MSQSDKADNGVRAGQMGLNLLRISPELRGAIHAVLTRKQPDPMALEQLRATLELVTGKPFESALRDLLALAFTPEGEAQLATFRREERAKELRDRRAVVRKARASPLTLWGI